MSDFGEHALVANRFQRDETVFCLDYDMLAIAYLRNIKSEPLARTGDSLFAHDAANRTSKRLGRIQVLVVRAYEQIGPMTVKVAEALPRFGHYGRSTVQKRISELALCGVLELVPGSDEALYRLNYARLAKPLDPNDRTRCPTCHRPLAAN